MQDDDRIRMWAGGGGGWDDGSSSSYEPPATPAPPKPGERSHGNFGDPRRRVKAGIVAGRFLPLHRGHQYLIEFARASVEKLVVVVFGSETDPLPAELRARWIRELYPEVTVAAVAWTEQPKTYAKKFAKLVGPHAAGAEVLFGSETAHAAAADALGVAFVPVDPQRVAVPTSGSAIRANVVEHFAQIAPPARPWLVRRVAVVGAESTGKTTLCARLRSDMQLVVVPEYARTLIDARQQTDFTDRDLQLLARSQIASEDALAAQATGGVLVCDTELRTIALWAERLWTNAPPAWIAEEIARRPYDLYLLCAPDIPFVGPPHHDLPEQRAQMHGRLRTLLGGQPNVVELVGSREERFRTAADAIISLHAPQRLLSERGAAMAKAHG